MVDGDVEIRAIAREPGHRTKIAVLSHDPNVDPVGACVGARGSRVRQVVNELRGEKVDIVEWREDTRAFISEALSPARVKEVRLDEEERVATVIVPDHQLSLAIGKEGQNARLAARLTGYKIDIRSESQDLGLEVDDETGMPMAADVDAGVEETAGVEDVVGDDVAAVDEVVEAAEESAAEMLDDAGEVVAEIEAEGVAAEAEAAQAVEESAADAPDVAVVEEAVAVEDAGGDDVAAGDDAEQEEHNSDEPEDAEDPAI